MIIDGKKYFVLNTDNTTYLFRITESGHLEHLYYGKKIRVSKNLDGLYERQEFMAGNNNTYSKDFPYLTLNNLCMEFSTEGKGDYREPMLVAVTEKGIRTSDFIFDSYEITKGKEPLKTLPSSYDASPKNDGVECLTIVLREKYQKLRLKLNYYVFSASDVITRTASLLNEGENKVFIEQFMSAQLDMQGDEFIATTFNGAWAREMFRRDTPLRIGKHINSSFTGTSSSVANPFFMISRDGTTQDHGDVYGFNLIYSGNHAEIMEVNEFAKTRILWGINPRDFRWSLEPKQEFEAPEAVMTFSDNGFNGMSAHMHDFVRNHITRGKWSKKPRPVLLNSWEASYFDINEDKLLKLAKAGKDIGIELFVMDDGWFGERNDDSSSLGDWTPNRKKLPGGLKGIADKINKLGMSFGIWVEPEMVNVKSRLYNKHPDWVLQIPGQPHSEGRNQRMLDLGRPEVQNYIIKAMSRVFSSANIEYVKWDMNRTLTDIYSKYMEVLSRSSGDSDESSRNDAIYGYLRQGEVTHRYIMGLNRCMKVLTEKFPDILFEGCAAGGNRFDLGILCYFPQIWGSDDTDALVRAEIQTGYSYGYPQCCWGSHISGIPNHQTLRRTPLETRYAVAAFGSMGVEYNLNDLYRDDLGHLKRSIEYYKKFRDVFQYGQFFRGRTFNDGRNRNGNITEWTVVSPDKKKAVGMIIQREAVPNMAYQYYRGAGLKDDFFYHFYNNELKVNIRDFGDLVNTVSPIHIKPGSVTQNIISGLYKLEGEKESLKMYGSTIMNAGVKLSPAYSGTGFNEKTRAFFDYSARVYYMEADMLTH